MRLAAVSIASTTSAAVRRPRHPGRCRCGAKTRLVALAGCAFTATLSGPLRAQTQTAVEAGAGAGVGAANGEGTVLAPVSVKGRNDAFGGGQVARNASVGMLGDRSLLDTPFNITSVTSQGIEDLQARTVGMALAGDASVRAYLPTSFMEQYTFRGFLVYNDDVSFLGLTGLMSIANIDAGAIERLEVMKGPSSMVSGVSSGQSLGGSMNIVPKRATDAPISQVTFDYATRSQLGTHVDLGRRFGDDKAWGVRVNATYRNGDMPRDDSKQSFSSQTVALDYRGQDTKVSLDAGTQRIRSHGVGAFIVDVVSAPIPAPPDNRTNVFPSWMFVENVDRFAAVRVEHRFSPDLTVHAAYGQARWTEAQINATPFIQDAVGTLDIGPYWRKDFGNRRSAEAGAAWHLRGDTVDQHLSLAFNYLDLQSGDVYTDLPTPHIASNLYAPVASAQPDLATVGGYPSPNSYTTLKSVGVADAIDLMDKRLQFVVGARLQQIESGGVSDGARESSYKKSRVTPMVGIVVKPQPYLSLYANYVEGLQQGDTVAAPYRNAGEVFAPFRSRQIELGSKFDFGGYGLTADVFQLAQPNEIATPDGAGITAAQQTMTLNGEQRNRGFELSLFGEPLRGVRLLGGLMLLDGRLVHTPGGTQDGNHAVGAPKVNVNANVEWDLPGTAGLTLLAGAVHTSSQYIDGANTRSIPAWTTFDVGLRYRAEIAEHPVVLRARLDNVFDRAYWASTARGFGISQGQPRTLQLSASVDF